MLSNGSIGTKVRELESMLVKLGYSLSEDALFDDETELAVMDFQRKKGLVIDSIAGPKTIAALKFLTPNPKALKQADIEKAADTLSVPVASIMAMNEVESNGSGFFENGRPAILYERHVMYKRLAAEGYDADSFYSKYPNLVNRRPGGYRGGWPEHTRLKSAQTIDHDIALESCSWGLFQIMGYHWQALGYESVQDFVNHMQSSEGAQLDAFVRFILADKTLHKALKAKKWADVARIYNGRNYARNYYDVKLARAYERHAKVHEAVVA